MSAIDTFTLAEPTSAQTETDQHQHQSLHQCVEHALQAYFVDLDGQNRKSGSAGMPRPISHAVFSLKKKNMVPAV